MKELKNCDINKMSAEELSFFGIVEDFENILLEIEHNKCEEENQEYKHGDCTIVLDTPEAVA